MTFIERCARAAHAKVEASEGHPPTRWEDEHERMRETMLWFTEEVFREAREAVTEEMLDAARAHMPPIDSDWLGDTNDALRAAIRAAIDQAMEK